MFVQNCLRRRFPFFYFKLAKLQSQIITRLGKVRFLIGEGGGVGPG